MITIEALYLAFFILLGAGGLIFLHLLVCNTFDRLLEDTRRKKHPEYFEYWDKALKLSFERGKEYNRRKGHYDYRFKLYQDGLLDGECTNECYAKCMNKLMSEYQELCSWFQEKEKEIRELLIKADLYAKEHNLLWGIIYDSKAR
jgi:endonuclease III